MHHEHLSRRCTATLCALLVVLAGTAGWQGTRGGVAWTFDEARQLDAQAGLIQAPPLRLAGSAQPLWGGAWQPPRAHLVDFIYTRCPGICLALGSEYQRMQAALAAEPSAVHLLSLSIDPAHDGPAELAEWAHRQRAQPGWWSVGRAATNADAQALLRALRVVVVPDGAGGFVHNGALHLIDAQGRLIALFDYSRWQDALAAARRVAAVGAAP
jgi:protein SCO1